jgi:hypothetical protein
VSSRYGLVALATLLVFALGATPAHAADPLESRWELVTPAGASLGAMVYDFVATSATTFTNKVVRSAPFGCGPADGDIVLTHVSGQGQQPAYRGTHAVRHHLSPCAKLRDVEVELVIRPDGLALLSFRDGSNVIQYYKRRSVEVGRLALSFRDRIGRAVTTFRPEIRRLGSRWNAVQARIADLHAKAAGLLDTGAERKEIATAEGSLEDYRRGLARLARMERESPGNAGLAAVRAEWEAKVRDFRVQIGRLQTRIARRAQRRLELDQQLRDALAERTRVDAALTEIGRRLSPYDFEVSEVTVTADGVVVFRAKADTVRARIIERIDRKLALVDAKLAALDAERKRAKADFLSAQREVTLAGERIATVVWQNFAAGAAADAGFLALDLGVAFARGGLIGLTAEVTKKAAETLVFALVPLPGGSGRPSEGSVEAELRELYDAQVKEVFSPDALGRTALERMLKETHFKILVKDPATDYLKRRVFDPIRFVAQFEAAGRAIAAEPSDATLRRLEQSVAALLATRERLADFARRQKTKPGTLRGLAESVAKDTVKLLIKKSLDARELEAWIAYFEKDLYARAVTAHFRAVSSRYWWVKGLHDSLENEKRSQLDRPSTEKVLVSTSFGHGATLRISLKGRGRPGELGVVLGSERAAPVGGYVYELRANADRVDSTGRLLLEVR